MKEQQVKQLNRAKQHAIAKGGECLSPEYTNAKEKAFWQCNNPDHAPWSATFNNVLNHGRWCPKCHSESRSNNRKNKNGLEQAKQHAISKGGKCLSQEYLTAKTKLTWQCGIPTHLPWDASFDTVVNSHSWCPQCANEKKPHNWLTDGLDRAIEHAKLRGGLCLSQEYINNSTKMEWQCGNNHPTWLSTFSNVLGGGTWCPECGIDRTSNAKIIQGRLPQAQQHALSKNGLCLSTKYVLGSEKLTWKCSNTNHKPWASTFHSVVLKNHWCPECGKRALSEQRTRLILETFFDKAFPALKPDWNINPWTNRRLELDGYCKEFNLAFEFDGEHHHERTRGKKAKDLLYQKFKDEQKRKNCAKNGVLLINIPIPHTNIRKNFEFFLEYIVDVCKPYGIYIEFSEHDKNKLEQKFFLIR